MSKSISNACIGFLMVMLAANVVLDYNQSNHIANLYGVVESV